MIEYWVGGILGAICVSPVLVRQARELARLKKSSIRIVLSEMSDEMLQSNLSTGPTASVWKGVSECVRRLKDRYADDAAGANSEAKASAMDRMTALDDLLILMDQWYRAKKEGER